MKWFNHITQAYEEHDAPQTDEEARRYIWQTHESQELYTIYRALGCTILSALRKVLLDQIGEPDQTPCP